MSKELNIIEASNMEYNEKEFKVKYQNGTIDDLTITNVNGDLIWNDISKSTSKGMKEFINAKFIPVEKPVSFMEAVKAFDKGKRIKSVLPNGVTQHYGIVYYGQLLDDEDELGVSPNEILNGKWYIED